MITLTDLHAAHRKCVSDIHRAKEEQALVFHEKFPVGSVATCYKWNPDGFLVIILRHHIEAFWVLNESSGKEYWVDFSWFIPPNIWWAGRGCDRA